MRGKSATVEPTRHRLAIVRPLKSLQRINNNNMGMFISNREWKQYKYIHRMNITMYNYAKEL